MWVETAVSRTDAEVPRAQKRDHPTLAFKVGLIGPSQVDFTLQKNLVDFREKM
jgi:hypothetical protein